MVSFLRGLLDRSNGLAPGKRLAAPKRSLDNRTGRDLMRLVNILPLGYIEQAAGIPALPALGQFRRTQCVVKIY
ncbi:MAG: hypothetical protein JWL86_4376 [Rhizobium sp.]|nr:hypothetical protein [Rhizobium sp.]